MGISGLILFAYVTGLFGTWVVYQLNDTPPAAKRIFVLYNRCVGIGLWHILKFFAIPALVLLVVGVLALAIYTIGDFILDWSVDFSSYVDWFRESGYIGFLIYYGLGLLFELFVILEL